MIEPLLAGSSGGRAFGDPAALCHAGRGRRRERAGIVNLGLEGVMLMGAAVGFATAVRPACAALGVAGRGARRGAFQPLFGFLVISRRANQLASGLAMMFCGGGLSALIGGSLIGSRSRASTSFGALLSDLPWSGRCFFIYDMLVYLAGPLAVLVVVGALSHPVGLEPAGRWRKPHGRLCRGQGSAAGSVPGPFLAGVLGGIAGAHLSIGLTMTWSEWMTAGRGFIAVALVIFSKWHPLRAIFGALLFGGAIALQLQMQAGGVPGVALPPGHAALSAEPGGPGGLGGSAPLAAPGGLGRVFQGTE